MRFHLSNVMFAAMFVPMAASSTAARAQGPILVPVDPPAGPGSLAPNVSVLTDGAALLSWLESVESDESAPGRHGMPSEFRLRIATYRDGRWSEPRTVIEGVPFFANWADVPSVVEAADGALIAHWLQRSGDGPYAYDVQLARSDDNGGTWTPLGVAHNDGVETEHGFVSLIAESGGARAFWLDGRDMAAVGEDDAGDGHGHAGGAMTLRTARITDRVSDGVLLDDRVCECCNTAAVMTETGPIVFYRDRSPGEIRDIWMIRYDGMEWTAPKPVHADNWMIPGCPVNGPAAAGRGSTVVVAWYTAADSRPQVNAVFSTDSGRTFGPEIVLDDTQPLGRVDVVLDERNEAIACWLDAGPMGGSIAARRVAPDGRVGPAVTLATSSLQRSSGFPRLARLHDSMLLVWTEDAPVLRVRAASLDSASIPGIRDESATGPD